MRLFVCICRSEYARCHELTAGMPYVCRCRCRQYICMQRNGDFSSSFHRILSALLRPNQGACMATLQITNQEMKIAYMLYLPKISIISSSHAPHRDVQADQSRCCYGATLHMQCETNGKPIKSRLSGEAKRDETGAKTHPSQQMINHA